ncbi:MAG: hypothetical protein GC182_20020 [Rhodopseudomonas sp.]|nr:hypothetical protein [Rhodopseudomonas sp.]
MRRAPLKLVLERRNFCRVDGDVLRAVRQARRRVIAVGLSILSLAFAVPVIGASAQSPQKYEVAGFREARFGMTERDVRAVLAKDFGKVTISRTVNPIEGTTVLTAQLASLDPAPGPAQVAYILGYSSKKLIQVNVIWTGEGDKEKLEPDAMVAAGTRLERYFAGYAWNKDTTRSGVPVGPNTVVLFSGEDDKKGAVRLIVDGVKYQMQRQGKEMTSPNPTGPAKLIINYIADRDNPDIAKIEKGKF